VNDTFLRLDAVFQFKKNQEHTLTHWLSLLSLTLSCGVLVACGMKEKTKKEGIDVKAHDRKP
jgi:hypothetical protein